MTAKSVDLSWFPGPDGGYNQTFSVSYRIGKMKHIDLYKEGIKDRKRTITITILMLQHDTQYEFRVFAHNKIGQSEPAVIAMKTRGK